MSREPTANSQQPITHLSPHPPITPSPLAGKTALVTGSTRGIGRTIAEWLAREGANIVVSGREQEPVDASVAALRELGVSAWGVPADLARVADAHRGHFWEVSDADWEYQVNVNYRSPFILAQHAARQMLERGIRGRIVNVSTIGAHAVHKDAAVYDSAKGAVEVMTKNMAFELAPHGITVNCVIPGAIAERPGAPERWEGWAEAQRNIPFGRLGRAEDIAAAVRFFCLPESEFTTGQSLLVDGGHGLYLHE